ncbi:MAG: glycosyl hydrolase family 18 protein, partial [Bacteroidota bacterium]
RNVPQNAEEDFARFVNTMGNWARNQGLLMMLKAPVHTTGQTPLLSGDVLRRLKADQRQASMDFLILEARDMQQGDTLSASAPIYAPNRPMDISRAVDYYLEAGVPADRIILEFPYYGYQWRQTRSGGHGLFGNQPQLMRQSLPRMPVRKISYFGKEGGKRKGKGEAEGAYFQADNGVIYTFEDSLTIARKYAWVKEKKLGGVGLYALGYNGGDLKMWEALADDFAANPPQMTYPLLAFLVLCLGGGIVYSVIKYWQVRNEIARKRSHQWYYGGALFMVGVVFLCCMIYVIPSKATAGSSTILIMFPFLRRIVSKVRRWV